MTESKGGFPTTVNIDSDGPERETPDEAQRLSVPVAGATAHPIDGLAPHGASFFHYTTREAAFAHILPTRKMRLRPYRQMRDPLEAKDWNFGLGYALDPSQHPDNKYLSEILQLAERVKDQTLLLSMTVDADGYGDDPAISVFGRGYARASMWELYAERHAGVCLVFDRSDFTSHFIEQMNEIGMLDRGEVRYTRGGLAEDVKAQTILTDNAAAGGNPSEEAARHVVQNSTALFFTKLLDWQGEHEYRFTLFEPSLDEAFCDFGASLQAVILGEQFPEWQLAGAAQAADKAGAELRQMVWANGRPWPSIVLR